MVYQGTVNNRWRELIARGYRVILTYWIIA
jgi:hypothetical protein